MTLLVTAFDELTERGYWVPSLNPESGFGEAEREQWCRARLRVIAALGLPPDGQKRISSST